MSHDFTPARRPIGFAARFLTLIGLLTADKPRLCADRMAALDDPQTRKALAHLPPHLLRDVGVAGPTASAPRVEGEALRKYMW